MYSDGKILVAKNGDEPICIIPKMANRHGLIAGATGTGKTITLKVLAESFSDIGVPVFLADVKGDLAGMCKPGVDSEDMQKRIAKFGLADLGFTYKSFPTTYWDIWGEKGLPLRTTITEMGPTLLARLMGLTQAQEDILSIVFKIADDEDLLLIDTKDLRAMLNYVSENNKTYSAAYGNMSKASINVIQRNLVAIDSAGGDKFFGEPALDIKDWFRTDFNGKGMINILDSESLINNPKMYSTFMLWMLSELFEVLPEAGDLEKPKMIFFFDEAHLLFSDAPKVLLQKIEQVVKLIRSKGVGVYFITQTPRDIPDGVLSQLGNKIQHALHAYTPNDMKSVKAAADSFRPNPEFDTQEVIQELGIGEAIVSFLESDGSPAMVQKAKILPPQSLMGPITDEVRAAEIESNSLAFKYADMVDRDSAYEFFQRKAAADQEEAERLREEAEAAKLRAKEEAAAAKLAEKEAAAAARQAEREAAALAKQKEKEAAAAQREKDKITNARKRAAKGVAQTAAGTVGREVGNAIGGTVGGKFGKKLGGNLGASLGRGLLGTLFTK
ncbi:MAG: DUF853 domain-containing protein [Lachnospiraceae bacterium]|nr:DUF853 domain-containing protein [Lachnospiraceae bacterium]